MNRTLVSEMACVALFLGMLLVSSVCYRLGRRRLRKGGHPTGSFRSDHRGGLCSSGSSDRIHVFPERTYALMRGDS